MIVSETFIKSWFALQRQLIAGLQTAYVHLQGAGVPAGGVVITYPEELEQRSELALTAELARRSSAPVTGKGATASDRSAPLRVAYPLRLGGFACGAVVVEVEAPLERQAAILQLLQWGEAWLNLALTQLDGAEALPAFSAAIAAGLAQESYPDAVTAVLALLPERVQCTRVALGRQIGDEVHLEAVSQAPDLAVRGNRAKAARRAMEEALAVGETQCWPDETVDVADHSGRRELVEIDGLSGVCTVPLMQGLRSPLVFSFEFAAHTPWDPGVRRRCEEAAQVVAPVIELRREHSRPWVSRFATLLGEGLLRLFGSKHRARGLVLITGLFLTGYFTLGEGDYRVSAPAVLEGAVQRALVAPFDGYIVTASVRAGQEVAQGDLLARLDDRDLQTERRRLLGEEAELAKQHRQAVAGLDHSEAKILEAQLAQSQARLALLDDRLARTELRAPFDGLVISGDWHRSLGVPVSRGELLFEIAPLETYRVALQVSDRDIAALTAGQRGELILTALPRQRVRLAVSDIATLATTELGEPAFRVEADLVNTLPELRPGMEGVAKVMVGQRRRWWIWTHALTDWLRLQLWRWRP